LHSAKHQAYSKAEKLSSQKEKCFQEAESFGPILAMRCKKIFCHERRTSWLTFSQYVLYYVELKFTMIVSLLNTSAETIQISGKQSGQMLWCSLLYLHMKLFLPLF